MKRRGRRTRDKRYHVQEGRVKTSGNSGAVYVPAEYIGRRYYLEIYLDDEPEED